ncbi:hypothetical protein LPJ59_005795, partial [Coemansia sp. RSA 2399]
MHQSKRRKVEHPPEAAECQYDWSASDNMSNWSLTSLTTGSSCKSTITMPTPPPDQGAPSFNANGTNEDTLVENLSLDVDTFPNVGSSRWEGETVNIFHPNSPTHRILKRRMSSAIAEEGSNGPRRKILKLGNPSASAIHERRALGKENSHHDNGSDSSNSSSSHHTPEKLYESYRPSGSPARVSGSRVAADVSFTDAGEAGTCRVDKSLVCKGFWEEIGKAGRICLPRRSGKTYNLTQLLLFYSISPEEEYLHSVPDIAISTGGIGTEDIQNMDVVEKCRRKREYLFEGSLLQTMHPEFYREHFMKYPVLHISFSKCKNVTLDSFLTSICGAIAHTTKKWLSRCKTQPNCNDSDIVSAIESLQGYLNIFSQSRVLKSSGQVDYECLVIYLLEGLSELVFNCFGRYMLLIDEYDIPFITVHLASWSKEEKQTAQGIIKLLFQTMLKDNRHLLRGLLFGVFEIPLTEMGSGANNIKDIRMVPCEESDIQGNIL